MIIQSLIKRPSGTLIELGTTHYHFEPNEHDDHVCFIEQADHIECLLAITEGFCRYDSVVTDAPEAQPEAPAHAYLPELATESEPEAERHYSHEQLIELYIERFGKKPHWRAGIEKLLEELELS